MSTNAFAKFGIDHLSPSSLNLWREHPARWSLQYLHKLRDPDTPRTIRGKAVEVGMEVLLRGDFIKTALGLALTNYDLNASKLLIDMQGEIPDNLDIQRNLIEPMLKQIEAWLRASSSKPEVPEFKDWAQVRIEYWLDDVPVPLTGFIDFLFCDRIWDLKTTERMPSQPRASHVRQMAVYRAARQLPVELIYVTEKRIACVSVSAAECDRAIVELRADAKRLEAFLSVAKDARHALSILPLNTEDYFLSSGMKAAYYSITGDSDAATTQPSDDNDQADFREREGAV